MQVMSIQEQLLHVRSIFLIKTEMPFLLVQANRVWLERIALPSHDSFKTPLGQIPLAKQLIQTILPLPDVEIRDDAHREEHSLEVQLSFLQETLEDFEIIHELVGKISAKNF